MTDPSGTRPDAQPEPARSEPVPAATVPIAAAQAAPSQPAQPSAETLLSPPPPPPPGGYVGTSSASPGGYAGHPAPARPTAAQRFRRRPVLAGVVGGVLVALLAFTGGLAVGRGLWGDDGSNPTSVRGRDGLGPMGEPGDGAGPQGRLPRQQQQDDRGSDAGTDT